MPHTWLDLSPFFRESRYITSYPEKVCGTLHRASSVWGQTAKNLMNFVPFTLLKMQVQNMAIWGLRNL